MQGEARAEFYALREEIVGCLALVEALIDFGEGEDIEEGVFEEGLSICLSVFILKGIFDEVCAARRRAQRLRDRIQSILADNRRGEIMRAGIRLAIFGPPNVGKSSLLNFLGMMTPPATPIPRFALTKVVGSSARGRDCHSRAGHDARHRGALVRYRRASCPGC